MRLHVAALAVVLASGSLVGLAGGPAAATDSGPTLLSVSAPSVATVGPDSTVSWQLGFSSADGLALSFAEMSLRLNGGSTVAPQPNDLLAAGADSAELAYTPMSNGTVVVTATTSHWLPAGDFELTSVELTDTGNHSTLWLRDGTSANGDHTSTTPPFSPADVQVANPHPDTTPPTITSLSLNSPAAITAGDPIVVEVAGADDLSGVATTSVTFAGPGGRRLDLIDTSPSVGDVRTLSALVPPHVLGGLFTLDSASITDAAGNTTSYGDGDASAPGAGSTDVQVLSPAPDTTAPTFTSLGPPLPPTANGGAIGTHFAAHDNFPGDLSVGLQYSLPGATPTEQNNPLGGESVSYTCDVWTGAATSQTISSRPLGTYELQSATVADSTGNSTTYARDGSVTTRAGGSTATVAGASPFDLAADDVATVAGAPLDTLGFAKSLCGATTLGLAAQAGGGVTGRVMRGSSAVIDPVLSVRTPSARGAVAIVTGDASGRFSARQVPVGSTVHFFGGRDSLGGEAPPADAIVTRPRPAAAVRVVARRFGGPGHRRLKVTVTISNGHKGDGVALERRVGGRWVVLAYVHANARRTGTLTVPLPVRGTTRVDVYGTQQHNEHLTTLSARLTAA